MSGTKHEEIEDVTQQVRTARDSMKLPATELEEAVQRHADASAKTSEKAEAVKRHARARSASPVAFPKPQR